MLMYLKRSLMSTKGSMLLTSLDLEVVESVNLEVSKKCGYVVLKYMI